MSPDPHADLQAAVDAEVAATGVEPAEAPVLERPKRAELGDYSTNAAMLLAPSLGAPPREVAAGLAEGIERRLGSQIDRVEVAGPGFLNLFMTDSWHRQAVAEIVATEGFGRASAGCSGAHLEFVSANPTGPLTAAGGRGAAYGDSLARLLEAAGHQVSREYYMNDAGSQIQRFAESISARMLGSEPPEDGYSGAYVAELADDLAAAGVDPGDLDVVAERGVESIRSQIEATLDRFGVRYDHWASERRLSSMGALERTLEVLAAAGSTYASEGALWLRTSDRGDDKDRVLVRSDGEPTYFAMDIAYHRDKLERGAEQMIVPLGADHHGYVPRMRAAVEILAGDPDRYEAPIMQLVNIVEQGERARMSKRKGDFVSLDELVDDIGADAARWFLLQRSHDTVIDLDLVLARSTSQENPVYYVQYAHARIASILARAGIETENGSCDGVACEPSERALIRRLLEFPAEVRHAAGRRSPHRIATYSTAVASDFHAFYRDCKVVGADAEFGTKGLEAARLQVCNAARIVIASSLALLGVSSPDSM